MKYYKPIKIFFILCILVPSILFTEDWPLFRGPTGQGISKEKNLPVQWSTSEGILWKTAIPGEGHSSPIVHGQRIYLTSAMDDGASCQVICLDLKSGNILWNKEVFRQVPGHKEGRNSYATPTPVTDGKYVFAVYNDGSIAAITTEGKLVWQNRDYQFYGQHGLGVSPILFESFFIIPFDGSGRPPDKHMGWQEPWDKAFILALNKNNGEEVWIGKRGLSRIAHVTPIVIRYQGEAQLVSCAGDVVQGFNPQTGKRIWTATSTGEGVVPSPVSGEGMIFNPSGFGEPAIRAIRLGGEGEVTKTHLVWEQKINVPMIPSFVYHTPYLFTITENGEAMCLMAKTGEIVWEERLPGKYFASPVYADGKIYYLSEKGISTIIEAGPNFKVVAKNEIGEPCKASFAISNGKILIRGEKHLYCIGKK